MIGIVDYNAGNLTSVCNVLDRIGVEYFISSDGEKLETAEKILFPGVGHAYSAMQELKKRGLDTFLQHTQKPVLGICLGMQLLFDSSEEGTEEKNKNTECLGLIEGTVKKFDRDVVSIIPHMGWNEVSKIKPQHFLLGGIDDYLDFYFVHSYYCFPKNKENIVAMTDYEAQSFCCIAEKDNFFGIQFHPEKSAEWGEKIVKNFCFAEFPSSYA
jgi:glutamine amidotransferase